MTGLAVVLGAGGTPGYHWNVGVLAGLAEATGTDPGAADVLVGTSAGSLVASSLRAGLSAADLASLASGGTPSPRARELVAAGGPLRPLPPYDRAGARWRPADARGAVRSLVRPWRTRPGALGAALAPAGGVDMTGVGSRQRAWFGDDWPERDLRVCAVRLDTGRRVAFGSPSAPRTDVATAVAASCAVPGYARPVLVDGVRHVDGGAWSSTNADVVVDLAPSLVVVVVPMGIGRGVPRRHPDAPLRRYLARQAGSEARRLRRAGCTVAVLAPGAADLAVLTLAVGGGDGPAIVAAGRETATARLRADPALATALARWA